MTVPGPQGGYRLARPAEEITLLAVVEAIEGRASAFRCTEIRQQGPASLPPARYRHPCAIASAMARAEAAWRRELQAVTVADIVQTVRHRAPAAAAAARTWFAQAAGAERAARVQRPGRAERAVSPAGRSVNQDPG